MRKIWLLVIFVILYYNELTGKNHTLMV